MEIVREVVYYSDDELELLGYEKDNLTWKICNKFYRVKEATARGIYFYEVKEPSK
jgi:hypothetical protein